LKAVIEREQQELEELKQMINKESDAPMSNLTAFRLDKVKNVVVEMPKFEFSDEVLLKQFEQQKIESLKVATLKPSTIPKANSTKQTILPFKHLYDVDTERMIMEMEDRASLDYEIAVHRRRFD